VTGGGHTVGVRWPSHPFIQAVIRECGFPLAAPSANLSTEVSPTTALHVRNSLGNRIRLIVDGGQSQVGIESTVLDLSVSPARLLRPGMIHLESLLAVASDLTGGVEGLNAPLRSPGLLRKHYSPKARLVIWSWQDEVDLRSRISNLETPLTDAHIIAHTRVPMSDAFGRVSVIPHEADAFGRAIYAELHSSDEAGARLIVVEKLPDSPEWQAIADRLQRASA
jgi:L-threonylcarbamoyladenylate synthase